MRWTAYSDVAFREKAMQGNFTFADIDGTLTPGSSRTEVREILEQKSLFGVSTARTPEIEMTPESYTYSCENYGFERPPYQATPAIDTAGFEDPAFMACLGTGIFIKHGKGYRCANGRLSKSQKSTASNWRTVMTKFLTLIDDDGSLLSHLSLIEDEANYPAGRANVMPLPYRIALEFEGSTAAQEKELAIARIRQNLAIMPSIQGMFRIHEELAAPKKGAGDDGDKKEKHVLFLTHPYASKEALINQFVEGVSQETGRPTRDMKLLTIGDQVPDLRAGCLSGFDASATFILVGGSSLIPYFTGEGNVLDHPFISAVKNRLRPLGRPGYYQFTPPRSGVPKTIIIGDEAFPGLIGSDSIRDAIEHSRPFFHAPAR